MVNNETKRENGQYFTRGNCFKLLPFIEWFNAIPNHDDLYKLSLSKMLDSAPYVAVIIPESFITSGLFLNRISRVISLKIKMFDDTDCPVCLALFSPSNGFKIYNDNELIGDIAKLREYLPSPTATQQWIFNSKHGDLGLIAIDSTKINTIRFVRGKVKVPEPCDPECDDCKMRYVCYTNRELKC
uniref:Uncharacterized protein n=1 Tax=viral metagenome TaxID=1070528 RepID=A0A6M3KY72_9ZZZZ